ncbi:MAG TPA: glycosyltransferase 87 family protein, partial [Blastocatellia bacterium]|nr:glycosyltransferase 87 family protein [Blastocatellia bacterium]
TIYPPVAQMIFFATCEIWPTVTGMKVTMFLFDLATIFLLIKLLVRLKMNPSYVLIYAWHPLIVWEFAQSGHVDAAVIAFVIAAHLARSHDKRALTGVLLGLATLTKFIPIILFPSLWKRWDWKMPVSLAVTIIACYLPYIKVGSKVFGFLPVYFKEEGYISGSRYYILNQLEIQHLNFPSWLFLGLAALLMGALGLLFIFRKELTPASFVKRSLVLVSAWTLIISPVHSWYGAWMIPFLCFAPWVGLVYYSCSLAYTHLFWLGEVSPSLPERIWNWQYRVTFAILIGQSIFHLVTKNRMRKNVGAGLVPARIADRQSNDY